MVDIISLEPKEGFANGGTLLRVKGTGFIDSPYLTARFLIEGFPLVDVPCNFISNDTLSVVSPPNPNLAQNGFASVSISNNAHEFSDSNILFYWIKSIVVNHIEPSSVFESGNVRIDIVGIGFVPSFPNILSCRFRGSQIVDALYISPTLIQCICPPSSPGNVSLEVTQNGVDYFIAGHLQYKLTPRFWEFSTIHNHLVFDMY